MMRIFTFVAIIILMSFGESFAGTYSGGDGTVGDPYQISTTADLIELSNTSADWSSHFILTQDIAFDADETQVDWDGDSVLEHPGDDAAGFSPIGNSVTNFTGTFNGQGFEIDNLYINRPSQNFVGLFGIVNNASSEVANIGVINVVIIGGDYVGGLVGIYIGIVNNCYSTGSVTGEDFVGGLIGENIFGPVSNCYSTCNVTGEDFVGGIVGYLNFGSFNNCYSTGSVSGSNNVGGLVGINDSGTLNNCYSTGSVSGVVSVGGLVGFNDEGEVTNSFWDMETSGQATSDGGTGKTTTEMKNIATFTDESTFGLDDAWDFKGNPNNDTDTDDFWNICATINDGYPYLTWQTNEISIEPTQVSGVYQISTVEHLYWLSQTPSAWSEDFVLLNDIDLTNSQYWNCGAGFSPIGTSETQFTGTFDGQGFEIDNLYINRPSQNSVGLFGRTDEATISNFGVVSCDITGDDNVGGLVGWNNTNSIVSNCFVIGEVTGDGNVGGLIGDCGFSNVIECYTVTNVTATGWSVGGLIGVAYQSNIHRSYSNGDVSASTVNYIGGLVGFCWQSDIHNSYSTASIEGNNRVGGLVGYFNHSTASINSCYSTGTVVGSTNVGGLVGENIDGSVNNSFWDIVTSGQATSDGGTGKTTAEMKNIATYTDESTVGLDAAWDFKGNPNDDAGTDDFWNICGTINSGYPYLTWQTGEVGIEPVQVLGVYQISIVEHLYWLSQTTSAWSEDFVLLNDIDLSISQEWDCGLGFSPIGNYITNFTGTFDGQGFEIENLFINRPTQNYVGLFGYTGASIVIENLGVTNVAISGSSTVGGLVGRNGNGSTISNCYSHGNVDGTTDVGALVGFNDYGTIDNSYSDGSVSGTDYVGGLVGYSYYSTLNNCYSTCNVIAEYYVGGLAGQNFGTVNNSYSSGSVSGLQFVGGLIGRNFNAVNNSYSTGDVSGDSKIGGLIGRHLNSGTVSNSYSTGSVTGDDGVGGLLGSNITSTVNNCYSTGSVTGNSQVGGLVGDNYFGIYSNNFWDTQTSGRLTSPGATGKTTDQMKTFATYTDESSVGLTSAWDFVGNPFDDDSNDDIWRLMATVNNGYPIHNWNSPDDLPCGVFVSDLYDELTTDWNITYFDNVYFATNAACDSATVNISSYTHAGDVDMTGYTFIIGDDDFDLNGDLTGGLIQTPSTGRLILPAVENVQIDFPMGDGNNNYTLKIICGNAPTNPILVRLHEQSVPGAIQDPMQFWDIEGDDNLDATIVFRIDKSAIAPKTLNTNSILRFNDGSGYVPMTENQVTINDMGTHYEIIIINVNQF